MHNGLIISLSLYPIKYLNEFFVSYGSFLETNILLALMSSILFIFYFCKSCFFYFFVVEIYIFSTRSYISYSYILKTILLRFWVYVE